MTTSPILILGGRGKTGRRVVAQLEAKGVPVRLASRSSEPRFDWYDESTWPGITSGTHTAYLAPPVGPTGLAQACRFVKQAAADGLRRVVLLSGRGVGSPGREFAVYESSLELEHAVKDSGADWTIVRPPKLTSKPLTGRYRTVIGGNVPRFRSISRADTAHAILVRGPECTGTLFIDEDVLAEEGITDLERYRADPEGGELAVDLFLD